MRRNVLAPLDDNMGTRRYVPAHRGKDPRGLRRHSQGGNRTHGPARWEELRGGKSFAAKLYAKGPDGTRGFAAGRGKPLSPEATPALHGRAANHDFGAADHGFALQPCDPPLVETPVALHNRVPTFGAADHESIFDLLQSPNDPSLVETPVAAQHEPSRRPAPQQNEPAPHRLPPGLGMTQGLRRVAPRVPLPVAEPAAAEVRPERRRLGRRWTRWRRARGDAGTCSPGIQPCARLNAALQACRYEEEDGAAPEAAAEPWRR